MFELHIDLPLSDDLNESVKESQDIMTIISTCLRDTGDRSIQFWLGYDKDRQQKNYLKIDNGIPSLDKSLLEI